jgi:glutathione peroxidase
VGQRPQAGKSHPPKPKADVTGEGKRPPYAELNRAMPEKQGDGTTFRERLRGYGMTPTEGAEVLWSFEKFLIGRDGKVAGRLSPFPRRSDRQRSGTRR